VSSSMAAARAALPPVTLSPPWAWTVEAGAPVARPTRSEPAGSLIPRRGQRETLVEAYRRTPGNAIAEQAVAADPVGMGELVHLALRQDRGAAGESGAERARRRRQPLHRLRHRH